MKLVQNVEVKNKKIFLRVDFNVPVKDGEITDTNRIEMALPTIKHLLKSGAAIILGTHLGRPEGKKSEETSIAPVVKELKKMIDAPIYMSAGVVDEPTKNKAADLKFGEILVLENLRWDEREEKNDADFAKDLADLVGENGIYVNDAFAVSHRANASVEAITHLLPSYAGFLLQSEVENLSKLFEPTSPFVVIIGGAKIEDKAGVIDKLAPKADKILLGGAVANTFFKARGENVGDSLVDEETVDKCREMMEKYGDKLVLPVDTVKDFDEKKSFKIMDIGAQSRTNFANIIREAKTVFWNGSLGMSEDARFCGGMSSVAKAMGENKDGFTVIAGGDTVGFVKQEKLDKNISFISTGGGAALEFLAGEKLPGIIALE